MCVCANIPETELPEVIKLYGAFILLYDVSKLHAGWGEEGRQEGWREGG